MKKLTSKQHNEIAEQFAELVVDGMDMKTLVGYAMDNLMEYYEKCDEHELRELVDEYDEDLFDELLDNVTQQYPKQLNTFEKETFLDINNTGGKY